MQNTFINKIIRPPARVLRLVAVVLCILHLGRYEDANAGELERKIARSVVLLKSATHNYCATGILLKSGNIITASHVADQLCSQGICRNLVVGITESAGAAPDERTGVLYKLLTSLHALDVAVLSPPDETAVRGTLTLQKTLPATQDADILLASYPGCRRLTIEKGKVNNVTALGFDTSATGSPGSSGGAYITSDGKLLGIATEAVSPWSALWGRMTGARFALRGQHIHKNLLDKPADHDVVLTQLRLLEEYWNSTLLKAPNPSERKWLDLYFERAIQGFRNSVLHANLVDIEPLRPLLALNSYPGLLIDDILRRSMEEPTPPLYKAMDKLVLMATTESKGLNRDFSAPLDTPALASMLKRAKRADLQEVLLKAEKQEYPGSELMWFAWGFWVAAIALILGGLYFASLGYVFAREKTFVSRLKYMLFVAILAWPFSFLGYLSRLRRLKRKEAELQ